LAIKWGWLWFKEETDQEKVDRKPIRDVFFCPSVIVAQFKPQHRRT
jgi:hypothetical protein